MRAFAFTSRHYHRKVAFPPIAEVQGIVDDRRMRPSVIRLAPLSPALLVLVGCGMASTAATCPRPATQADVLPYRASSFAPVALTPALRQAVARVQACRPSHPVFGGPAVVRFEEARQAPDGHVLLRFGVAALADMYLVYAVDRRGRLLKAYVDGP